MQGIKEWPCGFVEKHGLLPPIIFKALLTGHLLVFGLTHICTYGCV